MKSWIVGIGCSMVLAGCGQASLSASPTPSGSGGANAKLTVQSYTASEKGVYVTSSLILGEHEALLVDTQFLDSEAKKVVDLVHASGRRLKTVYLTHAHPDHRFGLAVIHAAFPEARILAAPPVAEEARANWKGKHDYWKPIMGADLSDIQIDPTPYDAPTIEIEGREVRLLGPVQGDDEHTVSVFVPDASTLITGDVSFSGTHVWLADSKPPQWETWLGTLAKLGELHATTVISGHHDPAKPHAPADLEATAQYIRDYRSTAAASHKSDDVVGAMSAKYPGLKLPIVLQVSAKAAFPN